MDVCNEHLKLSERITKTETKVGVLCVDQTTIFSKIDTLTTKVDEAIQARLTKGITALIAILSSSLAGLISSIITAMYVR